MEDWIDIVVIIVVCFFVFIDNDLIDFVGCGSYEICFVVVVCIVVFVLVVVVFVEVGGWFDIVLLLWNFGVCFMLYVMVWFVLCCGKDVMICELFLEC